MQGKEEAKNESRVQQPSTFLSMAMRKRKAADVQQIEKHKVMSPPPLFSGKQMIKQAGEQALNAKCQECKGESLIQNTKQGNIVCQICGLVQSSRIIDETAEWRNFGDDDGNKTNMNRIGGVINPYVSNSGIETSVMGKNANLYSKWLTKGS